ncbi:MAG: c-type cytochrome [Planctomycetes bacterium]|nr:c-type cytochrome [Planctomycetota bacterium]
MPRSWLSLVWLPIFASSAFVWSIDQAITAEALASRNGGPIVPGLHSDHPLDEHGEGSILIGELGCANCHADLSILSAGHKIAPDLNDVGARVSPEFLRKFIAQPSVSVPGSTMPHMLDDLPAAEREEAAESIAQFLISHANSKLQRDPIASEESDSGRKLFHSVGCVACHDPHEAVTGSVVAPSRREGSITLGHLPEKYTLTSLAEFLYDPLAVRPSGRMPDMSLSRDEARSIASYLLDRPTIDFALPASDFPLAGQGREYFEKLNCASCHALDGVEVPEFLPLVGPTDGVEGCLSPNPEGAPDYQLTSDQIASIRIAISVGPKSRTPHESLADTLTRFNCIACHERNGYGGVADEVNPYFGTDEPALGDEARIPPALSEAGAKLNHDWLHKVLFDRARVRPYMHVRMPQYGEDNLTNLADQFESSDLAPPIEIPVFRGKQRGEMHEAARDLVGSDMLACINCHAFNGKPSPAMNGIDLTTTAERLQPAWFKSFLINPQAHRPGVIMPSSWPSGEALRQDVLGGDANQQIDAIWSYLEQGRTARDPKGIRNEPTALTAESEPLIYRGRSGIAGFRGIAVGFPGGMSYAFNAETGALSGIWHGGFVRVRWDSQGAGDFNPVTRPVYLAKDLAFFQLGREDQVWPLLPLMTEEEPVNPDPLYPRRLGYRFRGYFLDESKVPTLMHQAGAVAIDERTVPGDEKELVRTIHFQTIEAQALHFRALAGGIEQLSPNAFRMDGLQLTIPEGMRVLLRPAVEEGQQELILVLDLPSGSSEIRLRYEVL